MQLFSIRKDDPLVRYPLMHLEDADFMAMKKDKDGEDIRVVGIPLYWNSKFEVWPECMDGWEVVQEQDDH